MKKVGFTIIMVIFILFTTVLTVTSQSPKNVTINDEAYRKLERAYVQDVCQTLSREGFANSGVTLTKEYQEDGTRIYQVLIHHKRILALSDKEQETLLEEIRQIPFSVPGCSFAYCFLVRS